MRIFIKDGEPDRVVDSVEGEDFTGWTEVAPPPGYDAAAASHCYVDGAWVINPEPARIIRRAKRDRWLLVTDFVEYSRRLTDTQRTDGRAFRDLLFDLDMNDAGWPTVPAFLQAAVEAA